MTRANESRPEAAIEDLAGELIFSNCPTNAPRTVGMTFAEADALLSRLLAGEVSIWQVPAVLASWFNAGASSRGIELADEVRQARWEADRLWLLALQVSERRDLLLGRLDAAHEAVEAADVDDVLDAAWRTYCDGLEGVRA